MQSQWPGGGTSTVQSLVPSFHPNSGEYRWSAGFVVSGEHVIPNAIKESVGLCCVGKRHLIVWARFAKVPNPKISLPYRTVAPCAVRFLIHGDACIAGHPSNITSPPSQLKGQLPERLFSQASSPCRLSPHWNSQ